MMNQERSSHFLYICLYTQVRAAGSKHSWSPLYADSGNILLLNHMMKRPDGTRIKVNECELLNIIPCMANVFLLLD